MVRAVALYEAGILSLFAVLRKTFDKNKPFQPRDVLQELIFIESGASQSWLRRCPPPESEHRLLCSAFWKNLGNGCHARYSGQRRILSASVSFARLVTADSWVQGTWLSRKDWLASRIAAVHENNLLPPHLVLHKEMKPNLMMQACNDQTARPPRFDFQNSFGSWQSIGRRVLRKGSLRPAYLRTVQLRFHRVPRNVNSSSSFFKRRSSAQLRGVPLGASGPADTIGSRRIQAGLDRRRRTCDSGGRPQARRSLPAQLQFSRAL